MELFLSIILFITCCVSQYIRGHLLRFDSYGCAGKIEDLENTEDGSIANAKLELLKTGRNPRFWYKDIQCESTKAGGGQIHCTRLKKHTGMHICYSDKPKCWR